MLSYEGEVAQDTDLILSPICNLQCMARILASTPSWWAFDAWRQKKLRLTSKLRPHKVTKTMILGGAKTDNVILQGPRSSCVPRRTRRLRPLRGRSWQAGKCSCRQTLALASAKC